jgi:SRSO17 transposase
LQIADESRFTKYITSNYNLFRTRTSIQVSNALKYCKGLFQSQKRNMERMCEKVEDSDYFEIQHFISDSPWDHRAVMDQVASNAGEGPVALLIDESAHTKKGKKSVGVARQYCGNTGKVDNCQVAVYAALSAGKIIALLIQPCFYQKSGQMIRSVARQQAYLKSL